MKTPVTKPLRQGKGAVVRFTNDEMNAIIAGLEGTGSDLAARMRERLEEALRRNQIERQTHAEHLSSMHEMSHKRLAMRGWHLMSASSDRIELHMRHGDFLADGEGWQYGIAGAFGPDQQVLRGMWQACLFSRKTKRWLYVGERPACYDDALAEGTAALRAHKAGLRGGDGTQIVHRSFAGVVDGLDVSHHYSRDMRHHGEKGVAIGRRYGDVLRLMHGRAIVKTVVGFFDTTENHRWHPTYDLWSIDDAMSHGQKERTSPFWCAGPHVWTLSVDSRSDQTVLKQRPAYEPTPRDAAMFKVFATRDEAIAYAATLMETWGTTQKPIFHMTVEVPDVMPRALQTPSDASTGEDVFAQAA